MNDFKSFHIIETQSRIFNAIILFEIKKQSNVIQQMLDTMTILEFFVVIKHLTKHFKINKRSTSLYGHLSTKYSLDEPFRYFSGFFLCLQTSIHKGKGRRGG